jgi:hypothetical protein
MTGRSREPIAIRLGCGDSLHFRRSSDTGQWAVVTDEEIPATLELRLLDPATRARPGEVRRLLHPDFLEVGASGRVWDREAILAALSGHPGGDRAVDDLVARPLADDVVLVTYRVRHGGAWSRRSSIWLRDDHGWRVRFHQGTPIR